MKSKIYSKLGEIKNHYDKGYNVIKYIHKIENTSSNSIDAIQISYDLQAGSYFELYKENPESNFKYTTAVTNVLEKLNTSGSIMEAGVEEAATLANVIEKLTVKPTVVGGFDISWSRIKYAKVFSEFKKLKNSFLFIGDIFNIPIEDNSVDILYTSHSIEPNGGKEKELLQELYRITNRYLVFLEPAYELASEEAKKRMEFHGYLRGIKEQAEKLEMKVISYKLLDSLQNPLNPTGLLLIEKKNQTTDSNPYMCPNTRNALIDKGECYFSEDNYFYITKNWQYSFFTGFEFNSCN